MVGVLFVCLGNICRSPMAEAMFRQKVKDAGLEDRITTDSAGTSGWHDGAQPHEGTRHILERYEVDFSGIYSRKINESDPTEFDYIVAMDANNLKDMNIKVSTKSGRAPFRMLDMLPDFELDNVPDPYHTGNFDEVYEMLDESCDRLLEHIIQNEGWQNA